MKRPVCWPISAASRAFCLDGCGSGGVAGILEDEDQRYMPTTHHSAAAERHLQAAHAHEAAAASHNMNDHMGAHEASKRAMELSREAHEHSERLVEEGAAEK